VPANADEIRIVHSAVPGRVRLHVPILYRNRSATVALQNLLSRHPAVTRVDPSVHTANVLILSDASLSAADLLALVRGLQQDVLSQSPDAAAGRRNGFGEVTATAAAEPDTPWHTLHYDAALSHLKTTAAGLSTEDARARLQRYGPNELKAVAARPLSQIVAAQFASLPVVLLIGSAALSVLTGGFADAIVIIAVIGLNAVIGAYTEASAERTILALTQFSVPPVLAARDGVRTTVAAADLVPGDVIYITRGNYVAVDARLIDCTDLTVAESALTGESAPVSKSVTALVEEAGPLAERVNMVYRGTVVTGGAGVAVVVATGGATELGRVQALVAQAAQPETPLQRQLRELGYQITFVTGAVSGCMVLIGVLRGYRMVEIVRVAISLAVAAIPEGLPTVSMMTLATGVRRLRREGLVVRRLDAVETLGAVEVICLDKTGTITTNRMVVQVVHVDGRPLTIEGARIRDAASGEALAAAESLTLLLRIAALCSDATVTVDERGEPRVDGTATEAALITLALELGVDVVGVRAAFPKIAHRARAEQRMYMTTAHVTPEGRTLVACKGRPDQVLSRSRSVLTNGATRELTEPERVDIEAANESLAGQGLRVLGFAFAEADGEAGNNLSTSLTWLGLVGIADPPRPGIRSIVNALHAAGLQTVMITGDQSATACAVARSIGLPRAGQLEVLDSTALAGIPDELLSALVRRVDVFSRVSPSNKLQIVRALQRAGLIVAMTGDGINDGPALKASDVGVAMGRDGAELAREVADIVLLEDDIGGVVDAIAEGRTIADDIRKSVHFIISTNLSELLFTLGATALGFGVPLTATQLLWINLLTDVFPELALAVDPAESDVLKRPPRRADAKLVSATDYSRLAADAAIITGAAMASYGYGVRRYGQSGGAGTMGFLTLTGGQLLHALSSRSDTHTAFDTAQPPNPWVGLSVAGGFAVQALAAFVPTLRRWLGITPVSLGDVGVSLGLATAAFVTGESLKLLTLRSLQSARSVPDPPVRTPPRTEPEPFVEPER
jgi:Ca2+-transporting ATPase